MSVSLLLNGCVAEWIRWADEPWRAVPVVFTSVTGPDVAEYVRLNSPCDEEVYSVCRASCARGKGLDAIPDTRSGRPPSVSFALLVRLAIVGSPTRYLSGHQVLAEIERRFPDISARSGGDWKVSISTALMSVG